MGPVQIAKKSVITLMTCIAGWNGIKAQSLSLDSCYAQTLQNYPLVKQYELIEKSKEYTLGNASKAYLPQVSFTGISGYIIGGLPGGGSDSDNFKLIGIGQINQTIWDGGATKAQKEIIAATAEADRASVEVDLYKLRSRVNQLFFGILLIDEQLRQIGQHAQILDNNAKRIKEMNDNGLMFKTDLQEVQVEQLKLNQQKIEFEHTRTGYLQMLSLLTGTEIDPNTRFEKPIATELPLDMKIRRPELAQFGSQRKLTEARAAVQRVTLMPKIGLLGAGVFLHPKLGIGISSLSSLGVVGLSTSWNISGLYKNSNEKRLTELAFDKIDVRERTFLMNIDLQTAQIKTDIEKQKAILAEDNKIEKLRTDIRKGYQLQYENGMSSMLDVLDATEKESEAQTQKALHGMQLLMTIYEYKIQTGN